jgi:hypothetical protein
MEFSRFYSLCFANNNLHCNSIVSDNAENNNNNDRQNEEKENKVGIEDYNPDKIIISYIGDILIKGFVINIHPSIKSLNLDFTSMKIGGVEMKITLMRTQFDFNICCKSIIFGPSKLNVGEKVLISNSSRKKREALSNIETSNYNSNDYMENSYSKILSNIEENTGLTGLIQKYNPNYKLKLKVIDDALEKIGNIKKKNNSFNDTELSILCNNRNNDNSIQYNDNVNNSNINLNDSKYGNSNDIIPINNNRKEKIMKGKKIFKIIYIIKLNIFYCFRYKQTLYNEKKSILCSYNNI